MSRDGVYARKLKLRFVDKEAGMEVVGHLLAHGVGITCRRRTWYM